MSAADRPGAARPDRACCAARCPGSSPHRLDRELPEHLALPGGRASVDYTQDRAAGLGPGAGVLRPRPHADAGRRPGPAAARAAVAGRPADRGHRRPRRLLARRLGGCAPRHARPLPEAPLAGQPGPGAAARPRARSPAHKDNRQRNVKSWPDSCCVRLCMPCEAHASLGFNRLELLVSGSRAPESDVLGSGTPRSDTVESDAGCAARARAAAGRLRRHAAGRRGARHPRKLRPAGQARAARGGEHRGHRDRSAARTCSPSCRRSCATRRSGASSAAASATSASRCTGAGSGFIIDPSGIIVTNNHVVGHADQDRGRRWPTARELPARVIGSDELTDVAVIQVTPPHRCPPSPGAIRARSRSATGSWPPATRSAWAARSPPASSRRAGRDLGAGPFDDFLQLDAPINPGNSGGPIVQHGRRR